MKYMLALGVTLVGVLGMGCSDDAEPPPDAPDSGPIEDAGPTDEEGDGTTIRLADGVVKGTARGKTRSFIGIPYAAPPTGKRRWLPPGDVESWSEPLDASGPGVACIQNSPSVLTAAAQTEDCLKLNVFAPQPASKQRVPVLVWFHGGNNRIGSANDLAAPGYPRSYDGAYLRDSAPREVLVVTVNYRLHALGFLAHPALTAEQGTSGNYGLMDQQAALRWVQHNIAAFGGDPDKVTVFGESAGATDICYLLVAKGSEGLFQRAIVESGVCTMKLPSRAEWEAEGQVYGQRKGCPGTDAAALSCLRAKAADTMPPEQPAAKPGGIMFFDPDVKDWGANTAATLGSVDGELIVEQPIESYKAGRFLRVPMIVGSNAREGSLFLNGATAFGDGASLMAALTRTYGDAAARIAAQYPVAKYSSANEAAIDLTGDSVFVCSAHTTAQLLSRHTDVFVYNWTRAVGVPPYSSYGATHAVELAWVWDWWRPELLGAPANESMLATQVADYWTRLAEFGDPNGEGLPTWPRYDASSDPELTLDLEIRTTQGRRAERCALWNDVRVGLWGDAWNLAR